MRLMAGPMAYLDDVSDKWERRREEGKKISKGVGRSTCTFPDCTAGRVIETDALQARRAAPQRIWLYRSLNLETRHYVATINNFAEGVCRIIPIIPYSADNIANPNECSCHHAVVQMNHRAADEMMLEDCSEDIEGNIATVEGMEGVEDSDVGEKSDVHIWLDCKRRKEDKRQNYALSQTRSVSTEPIRSATGEVRQLDLEARLAFDRFHEHDWKCHMNIQYLYCDRPWFRGERIGVDSTSVKDEGGALWARAKLFLLSIASTMLIRNYGLSHIPPKRDKVSGVSEAGSMFSPQGAIPQISIAQAMSFEGLWGLSRLDYLEHPTSTLFLCAAFVGAWAMSKYHQRNQEHKYQNFMLVAFVVGPMVFECGSDKTTLEHMLCTVPSSLLCGLVVSDILHTLAKAWKQG